MAEKRSFLMPMPAFADPAHPEALGGSINFIGGGKHPEAEDHPMEHSEDYGGGIDMSVPVSDDDRESWTLPRWKELASEYGLSTGGTKNEVIDRVETHEADAEGGV